MAIGANCRDSLLSFERACRDKTINFETLHPNLDQIFLVNGGIPNELENLEILDAFATHFTTNCEEDVRKMVFHLLFPCSANVNHLREEFLVKLAQLAICIGLTPILDLVAIRLKAQVYLAFQWFRNSSEAFVINEKMVEATRAVSRFVTRIIEAPLSVNGLSESCKKLKSDYDFSDSAVFELPFINVLRLSPLFVSTLISAITLTYSMVFLRGEKKMYPPALILEILIIWLKFSQSQASRHDWASVDWEAFLLTSPPLFLEDIKTKRHELPALIAGAWPPARGIVWLTVLSSTVLESDDLTDKLLAELHYELLENLLSPIPRGKHSRGSSAGQGESHTVTWRLSFPCDVLPLLEYLTARKNWPSDDNRQRSILRACQVLHVALQSGRLSGSENSGVVAALQPFQHERIVQIICQGLRR